MTPEEVCDAIDDLAIGDYSSFARRLVGPRDQRRVVGAEALLDTATRGAIEDRFARRFETFDARAVHSIWMKWYLNAFIPPVLLADILLGQSVGVDLAQTRFIIADDGRVEAVSINGVADSRDQADPFLRFRSLIFDHFTPLIEMWSSRTEVTRRVFWSNVGNTFEAMLRRIEAVSGPSERLAQAQRIVDEPDWLGQPNPLFDAVHYVSERSAADRRRRVCCLQYLLPDRRFCRACPIEEARAHFPGEGTPP